MKAKFIIEIQIEGERNNLHHVDCQNLISQKLGGQITTSTGFVYNFTSVKVLDLIHKNGEHIERKPVKLTLLDRIKNVLKT